MSLFLLFLVAYRLCRALFFDLHFDANQEEDLSCVPHVRMDRGLCLLPEWERALLLLPRRSPAEFLRLLLTGIFQYQYNHQKSEIFFPTLRSPEKN